MNCLGKKGKYFAWANFFFNRVGPVAEISLLLNQMYVFVFGLGSYLPAAAASFITNEVQRGEAAVSASYTSVFQEFCRFGHYAHPNQIL